MMAAQVFKGHEGDIHVPAGEHAEVMIRHCEGEPAREITLGAGASLTLIEIVESSLTAQNRITQAASSRMHTVLIALGGDEVTVESTTNLAGPRAESDLHALWFATGTAQIVLNTRIEHSVPDCRSFQLVKGIASDRGQGVFTGEIYVAPDAQHTVALQQSRNMLLGEQARIQTRPQLEIYADDVKCSHGATVGQMDDEAIFYMRQRGLSDIEARRLQIQGFANDIIRHISNPEIEEFIRHLVQQKIDKA